MRYIKTTILAALCMACGVALLTSCDYYERTPVTKEIYVNKSTITLFVDNEDVTGQIELASSGSLIKFAYTTSASITLPKGRSKLKFYMDKASYNLLEMKFTYKQP